MRRRVADLSTPVLIGVTALLAGLIVLPMGWLVGYGFADRQGGATIANFVRLFTDPSFVEPLIATLVIAVTVSLACCLVAAPLGWLVARTDMPLRRTVRTLVMASFVTPPFVGAIAWEMLAAPNRMGTRSSSRTKRPDSGSGRWRPRLTTVSGQITRSTAPAASSSRVCSR